MSNYDINSNPALVKQMIENSKKASEKYFAEHSDSLIPPFEQELHNLGFQFEISEQIKQFLPKHKKTILPIAIKYYQQATYDNEKNYFISLFHYRGFEEVIPMLLNDFYSDNIPSLTRQFIGEALRTIRSKKYIDDYLEIIAKPQYGLARVPIFSLVGDLKVERAIPILVHLLVGGAVGGAIVVATGNCQLANVANGFISTGVGMSLEKMTGDSDVSWKHIAVSASVDSLISLGMGDTVKINKVTAGRNSMSAVYKSGLTKLRNGTASTISKKVIAKGLFSEVVGGLGCNAADAIKRKLQHISTKQFLVSERYEKLRY